jgi:hypothetical protein
MGNKETCGVCQDGPCTKEHCVREPFKIESCIACPASDYCRYYGEEESCIVKEKIEKLVNERKV